MSFDTYIDPLMDGISKVELLAVSGSDLDVVNAARVSRNKHTTEFTDKDRKLLRFLLLNNPQHTSPFEHNSIRFRVKLPIFVVREWHRHRVGWNYNEVSGRYVEFGKEFPIQFYKPPEWRYQSTINRQASVGQFNSTEADVVYTTANMEAIRAYDKLIEMGVARELARGVLPLCLYTEMYATCNLVSLFHFLKLRFHKDAQKEIMEYAKAMMTLAEPHFPESFSAWKDTQKDNYLINTSSMVIHVGKDE